MTTVIEAQGLGKRYRLGESGYVTLRERLGDVLRPEPAPPSEREVWALRNVDMAIEQGETVGIIGRNGAGKTTFLRTVARIVRPTTGLVRIRGRVGALLEVGTGFHPELTGRENVFLNGVVLGMTRKEVARRFDEIVEFAGVERFLETPLKRYSSGMYLRLAFAVAAHVDPDVLIVDEVLAVGDAEFQRRCLGRLSELGEEGRTVLFVSHDSGAVARLCTRAVWLEHGRVRDDGPVTEVVDRYLQTTVQAVTKAEVDPSPHGVIERLSLSVHVDGEAGETIRRDQPLIFELTFASRAPVRALDAAIYLIDRHGIRVVNENLSDVKPTISESGPARYRILLTITPILAPGEYVVGVWLGSSDELFFRGELLRLPIAPLPSDHTESVHGLVRPAVEWSVEQPVGEPGAAS